MADFYCSRPFAPFPSATPYSSQQQRRVIAARAGQATPHGDDPGHGLQDAKTFAKQTRRCPISAASSTRCQGLLRAGLCLSIMCICMEAGIKI
jgi:hypothetical protein